MPETTSATTATIDMPTIQQAVACVVGGVPLERLPAPLHEPLRIYFAARQACHHTPGCDFIEALAEAGWDFDHWGVARAPLQADSRG